MNIYQDGSVLVTHGGIELGQGLYTKMIQVRTNIIRDHDYEIYGTLLMKLTIQLTVIVIINYGINK